MSIKKISNKNLSRNLKTKKTSLQVPPISTLQINGRLKTRLKKQMMTEKKQNSTDPSATIFIADKVIQTKEKIKKISRGKKPIRLQPLINFHFPMNTLQWILLLILMYIAAGVIIVLIQEGTELLKNIIIYSIIGFFTFFMGCIGWVLARDVLEIVQGKKNIHNEAEIEI